VETTLCLVRHGATDWNFDMRMQGHADQPLNEEGRRQAERAAERLAAQRWDAIYTSDLARARETAEALARRVGLPVHLEPGLRERNMGVAEGWNARDRRMRWPETHWKELPGVEQDGDLAGRAVATLERIAGEHPGRRVLVVSHGGLLHAFLNAVTGGPVTRFHRNTAFTLVARNAEGWRPLEIAVFDHMLEPSGLEYTGERGRVGAGALRDLYAACGMAEAGWPEERLQAVVELSAAAWSAWQDGRLVAFARAVTDTAASGLIDRCAVHPDWSDRGVLEELIQRVRSRYPAVDWVVRQAAGHD
jgi:2,3-bisphosphoglycerate-dependent phosphoglycerate mutase